MQKILSSKNNYIELNNFFKEHSYKNILLVCSNHFYNSNLHKYIEKYTKELNINVFYFDKFEPNPSYESVCLGIEMFNKNNCNFIIAVGGGSAMDVAKCIKLYANMNHNKNYLKQEVIPNDIEMLAVPTTAGTGSEATKFAVIYYKGEKQSITSESFIPQIVLFDSSFLKTLPLYQKKATVLDAFSHSIESIWSVNSTSESIKYATKAIKIIISNFDEYLLNNNTTFEEMLKASNYAGKAINITKTTAGHAMCYKLTSLYKISHGHAAMMVNSELLPYMIENQEKCIDKRGINHFKNILEIISTALGCSNIGDLKLYFANLLKKLDLYDVEINYDDINLLVESVNIERLANNPIKLDNTDINKIYTNLFDKIMEEKNESKRFY